MPTCIRVVIHNFILMFVHQCVNLKKPFPNRKSFVPIKKLAKRKKQTVKKQSQLFYSLFFSSFYSSSSGNSS